MNFEDVGKAVDRELEKLREYFDRNVKPATKKDAADLLRKAAERLTRLAESVEKKEAGRQ